MNPAQGRGGLHRQRAEQPRCAAGGLPHSDSTDSKLNILPLTQVKEWIVSKLPEGPTLYPKSVVSEQPERFFVAEMIREKIFLLYSQEVPYSVQVGVDLALSHRLFVLNCSFSLRNPPRSLVPCGQVHIKEFREWRKPSPAADRERGDVSASPSSAEPPLGSAAAAVQAKDFISAAIMVEKESQVR